MKRKSSAPELVVTDLDGTLMGSNREAGKRNLHTLHNLGEQGILRVIATGRSLFSARKVVPPDFPVDYLIFSSGAGIMDWPGQRLLREWSLTPQEVARAFHVLSDRPLDFMVHRPIPDNHHFLYFRFSRKNPDFETRCSIYREFALPGTPETFIPRASCQLVAIQPAAKARSAYESVKQKLPQLKVIRTTSPIDGASLWIEIFPRSVSKARGAEWLLRRHGVADENVLAVGNDYNDLDLLRWAKTKYLVNNAPKPLHDLFPTVAPNDDSGFSEAVSRWQGRKLIV